MARIISWAPIPGTTYNVYWSSKSGGPYVKQNVTPIADGLGTFTDSVNVTGFWVLTAIGASGKESKFSNELSPSLDATPPTYTGIA